MDFLSTPLPANTGTEEIVEKRYVSWNSGLGYSGNTGKKWSKETRKKHSDRLKNRKTKSNLPVHHKYDYYTPAGGPFTREQAMIANQCSADALTSRCKRKTFSDWYRVKKAKQLFNQYMEA